MVIRDLIELTRLYNMSYLTAGEGVVPSESTSSAAHPEKRMQRLDDATGSKSHGMELL